MFCDLIAAQVRVQFHDLLLLRTLLGNDLNRCWLAVSLALRKNLNRTILFYIS